MLKLLRIFFTGIFIAFLGALPLGTQNLAAMQIAIDDGVRPAIEFNLGMVLADIFYVMVTLLSLQWIQKQKKLFKILEWITLIIIISLAVANFYAAMHPVVHKNVLLSNTIPRFLLGIIINGVNPMQIPFWLGWSTVLFTKKIMLQQWKYYYSYVAGTSIGMFVATLIFILGGRFIADRISNNQNIIYFIVGGIFTITGIIQIWKMLKKKDVAHKMQHPEEITPTFEHTVDNIHNQTN